MAEFRGAAALAVALPLAVCPVAAQAQGTAPHRTAPAQGVTQPSAPPNPEALLPAPKPENLTDGRSRTDQGGGAAQTDKGTTSSLPLPLPLPPAGQANPGTVR